MSRVFFRAPSSLRLLIAAVVVCGVAVPSLAAGSEPSANALSIETLSNRADLISGGNARVAVTPPAGVDPNTIRVSIGQRDVTRMFAVRPTGRYEGLVTGLRKGENVLRASAPGATAAALTITNHPIGGPVFAGPQIHPWVCQAGATDKQCNAPTTYALKYLPSLSPSGGVGAPGVADVGTYRDYDAASPPDDSLVAKTTTDGGVTVPYIVRVETGYVARDQYQIATLFDPQKPWAPWAPQAQWNHKLLITHGASCGVDHRAGAAPSVLNDDGLSRGFVVMSTAADNAGHNCNIVTQAESLVMAKERVAEAYGDIRYTIGTGCSGGSLTQQQVANAYPGLYQAILPACSFPDAWTTGTQLEDYVLLRQYHEDPSRWAPGVTWTPLEVAAVEGHPNHANSIELSTLYGPLADPSAACAGVSAAERYDASTNPKGVRCSLQDFMVNVFGKRKEDGFAHSAYDNVGAQYGLGALMSGQITTAQFVDLNVKAGSHDVNYQFHNGRVAADPGALARAYQSGAFNETNNMDQVAVIDLRGPDPGAFHDAYRAWAVRARLEREHGTSANHIIWQGFAPITGDEQYAAQGLVAADRWLRALEKDLRAVPLARKIIEARPPDVHDQCSDGVGHVLPSMEPCRAVVQLYTTPRVVAGSPLTTDTIKCQLKPLVRGDYYPVQFRDEEWAALTKVFPTGVCDYSKPGVAQQKTRPWQTYEDGPGTGHPLGPPPRSTPVR